MDLSGIDPRDTVLINEPGCVMIALGRRTKEELDDTFFRTASRMQADHALVVADLWGVQEQEAIGILADYRIPPHGD